ncbi:MAG: gliding motility protein GldN [Aureispira sp.]|nr:gliding motility protein GldN [Aureispira sp.]
MLTMSSVYAQGDYFTESGQKMTRQTPPRDGIYDRTMHTEKRLLPYDFVHERDVMWEKRIWREIDVRQKMNHIFRYPKAHLISILLDEAKTGNVTLYSPWNDEFTEPLNQTDISTLGCSVDSVLIYDPITFEERLEIVKSEMDPDDVIRYRIKEVWYFDSETSRLNVRILGIAPIINRYDEEGNLLHSAPMFWAYYPELRHSLVHHEVFNDRNDAARFTWDDIFEARMFASHITKASNIHDKRLQDDYTGIDILLEADKIKQEIFNFEHDLWSY